MHTPFLQALIDDTDTVFLDAPLPSGGVGKMVGPGAWLVTPESKPALELVISCGIHGNETAPIELVDQIVGALREGRLLAGARVLFLIGNLQAMRAGKRYLVEDINRLFCGKHAEVAISDEVARAAELEQLVTDFFGNSTAGVPRWHLDLHTAIRGSYYEKFAIYPYTDGEPHDKTAITLLSLCDVYTLLLHTKPSPTFSYFTSHHFGARAFTLELGKARPFGQNGVVDVTALERVLLAMVSGQMPVGPTFDPADYHIFQATRDVTKTSESFRLNLSPDVLNFTPLEAGTVVAEDGEYQLVAAQSEHIIFPNPDVKVGLRAGILVAPAELTLVAR
ncbi:succinylglutamate desuccinylase [Chitinivorax sp. B]|uniref:succinylglutamate desuccinylase n=1 Tax=Chitinivorax sp. B TaxID=2502235 RepID=UPI0010F68BC4|nr:succinylglutamate desuccinylase [Chitinivorax sp. B]